MTTHNLKTWMPFYQDVIDGRKTFELRKNDRDHQVGDTLNLIEVDPDKELAPTGRQTNRQVVYMLTGWGLQEGYVVLAINYPFPPHSPITPFPPHSPTIPSRDRVSKCVRLGFLVAEAY